MENLHKMSNIVNHSLDLLAPKVKEHALVAIGNAVHAGYPVKAFETYRSPERQNMLYAQGRTMPGRIITDKKGWESFHQYGLALDIAFWVENDWSWKGDFKAVSKYFIEQGFEWLSPMEEVHFQMRKNLMTSEAYRIAKADGIKAVWDKLWPLQIT